MLEICDLGWRPVAGEDDLLMAVEERVEGVEELLLRTFFPSEKLDVIDQQQVGLAISFPKFDQIVVLNRVDEFIDEHFAGKVHHLRVLFVHPDILADRLHQVRLAESHSAVNEKRVVGARRRFGHRQARGMRDFVVRADHERFEAVARIQAQRTAGLFGVPSRVAREFLGRNLRDLGVLLLYRSIGVGGKIHDAR